jgi:hypothetical protein
MFEAEVNKEVLIIALERNKSNHVATYERAWEKYREAVLAEAARQLDEFKAGKGTRIMVGLTPPSNHENDYEIVLGLLKMSTESTVTLSDNDFRQYVLDDWDWKQQWATVNSSYLS